MFSKKIQQVINQVDKLRDQVDDHWQVSSQEALLLAQLVRLGSCKSICEIGMSYGFSTLHLTAATSEFKGHLHSIDNDPKKIKATGEHLFQAGLKDFATLHLGDGTEQLANLKPEHPFDFVFIDAVKQEYLDYLEALLPNLARQVTIVADNASTHAAELEPFTRKIRSLEGFNSCLVPIGNGIELAIRRALACYN